MGQKSLLLSSLDPNRVTPELNLTLRDPRSVHFCICQEPSTYFSVFGLRWTLLICTLLEPYTENEWLLQISKWRSKTKTNEDNVSLNVLWFILIILEIIWRYVCCRYILKTGMTSQGYKTLLWHCLCYYNAAEKWPDRYLYMQVMSRVAYWDYIVFIVSAA